MQIRKIRKYLVAAAVASALSPAQAAAQDIAESAFAVCSSKAYLTQGWQPSTHAVNLVTGDYTVVASQHNQQVNGQQGEILDSGLNALGFNMRDHYVYGWSYLHRQPVRVHNDWSVEPLDGVNITNKNFYVGDVSTDGSKYYVYRPGNKYGLYSIGLNPESDDYMQMQLIIDGAGLDLKIGDFAFSPLD